MRGTKKVFKILMIVTLCCVCMQNINVIYGKTINKTEIKNELLKKYKEIDDKYGEIEIKIDGVTKKISIEEAEKEIANMREEIAELKQGTDSVDKVMAGMVTGVIQDMETMLNTYEREIGTLKKKRESGLLQVSKNIYNKYVKGLDHKTGTELKNLVDETYKNYTGKSDLNLADAGYGEDWWAAGIGFWDTVKNDIETQDVLEKLVNTIKLAGNAIFIVVAIVLGIKYMLGSAEGKTDIKEGLVSLLAAILIFYGASSLFDLFIGEGYTLVFIQESEDLTIGNLYDTVIYFLNYVAVGVVIYVGIKYLMSGAEGKAELKGKGIPFVVGLALSFGTLTFLNFLRVVLKEMIG